MSQDRMRRQVDPLGVESATSTSEPDWTGDQVQLLIKEIVDATCDRFPEPPVTSEMVGFMNGYAAARGWTADISDILLAEYSRRRWPGVGGAVQV